MSTVAIFRLIFWRQDLSLNAELTDLLEGLASEPLEFSCFHLPALGFQCSYVQLFPWLWDI